MRLLWDERAWEQYCYWQKQDRKTLKRINALIKDAQREPYSGIGKPEALRENLRGWWSRRIDYEHRLVYRVEDGVLVIIACKGHYVD